MSSTVISRKLRCHHLMRTFQSAGTVSEGFSVLLRVEGFPNRELLQCVELL